jgi:hypothetical protein
MMELNVGMSFDERFAIELAVIDYFLGSSKCLSALLAANGSPVIWWWAAHVSRIAAMVELLIGMGHDVSLGVDLVVTLRLSGGRSGSGGVKSINGALAFVPALATMDPFDLRVAGHIRLVD